MDPRRPVAVDLRLDVRRDPILGVGARAADADAGGAAAADGDRAGGDGRVDRLRRGRRERQGAGGVDARVLDGRLDDRAGAVDADELPQRRVGVVHGHEVDAVRNRRPLGGVGVVLEREVDRRGLERPPVRRRVRLGREVHGAAERRAGALVDPAVAQDERVDGDPAADGLRRDVVERRVVAVDAAAGLHARAGDDAARHGRGREVVVGRPGERGRPDVLVDVAAPRVRGHRRGAGRRRRDLDALAGRDRRGVLRREVGVRGGAVGIPPDEVARDGDAEGDADRRRAAEADGRSDGEDEGLDLAAGGRRDRDRADLVRASSRGSRPGGRRSSSRGSRSSTRTRRPRARTPACRPRLRPRRRPRSTAP